MPQSASSARLTGRNYTWRTILAGLAVGLAGAVGSGYARRASTSAGRDWDQTLRAEHRMIDGLFDKLRRAPPWRRRLLERRIRALLIRHAIKEERILYPVVAKAIGEEQANQLYIAQADIKTAMNAMRDCRGDSRLPGKAAMLRRIISEHVVQEELILPELKDQLSDKANADLTAQLHRA